MLMGMMSGGVNDGTLYSILKSLNLTTGLILCLDAADDSCYGGSGQTFADDSPAGNDFHLGNTSGSESSDPTFNGSAGGKSSSEYFSFDGGDYFDIAAGSNPAEINQIHRNSVKYTFLVAHYCVNGGSRSVISTETPSFSFDPTGFQFGLNATEKPFILLREGNGVDTDWNVLSKTADTAVNTSAWNIYGLSINESTGAGGGFFYLNGAYNQVSASDTFDATYYFPGTQTADPVCIGADPDHTNRLDSGERIACVAVWYNNALSKANMDKIYNALAPRFGL